MYTLLFIYLFFYPFIRQSYPPHTDPFIGTSVYRQVETQLNVNGSLLVFTLFLLLFLLLLLNLFTILYYLHRLIYSV